MRRWASSGFGLLLVVALAAGCAQVEVFRSGDTSIPDYSATDWVSYGDHVVVLRVEAEARVPGDGSTTGRTVDVVVERTLWSRPTATTVPTLPTRLTQRSGGWARGALGIEHRYAYEDDPARLEVGHRYLALMIWTGIHPNGSGTPQWWRFEALPFDDGVVGHGSEGPIDRDPVAYPMRAELWSKSTDEVVAVLATTPPDPRLKPFMDEDPAARYQHAI